jgi:hypothetical protein
MLKGRVMPDLKSLEELGVTGEDVAISVMVMPGGDDVGAGAGAKKGAGKEAAVVEDEVFWKDLGSWLKDRVGDEDAEVVGRVFREAWRVRKVE